jgi:hypothetical protein
MALGYINTHLRNERIRERKLSKCKAGDGELSDAEHAEPELSNADNAAAELTDGDYAARHNGRSIGPEFERNMQERQSSHG